MTSHVHEMLRSHPAPSALNSHALAACIEACFACAQACVGCADACLAEADVAELRKCIRLNQDCAMACAATGSMLSRQYAMDMDVVKAQVGACLAACRSCAGECELHAEHHMHCQVCANACRDCEQACELILMEMMSGAHR